jgi:hypothetical protein
MCLGAWIDVMTGHSQVKAGALALLSIEPLVALGSAFLWDYTGPGKALLGLPSHSGYSQGEAINRTHFKPNSKRQVHVKHIGINSIL